jgi:hypothetical protein
MPYNSYFPVGYQPSQTYYPQYVYPQAQQAQAVPSVQPTQPQQQSQPMTSGIIWVQGEAGAKSYLVAPNTTVQLWDSERQTIYIKSADASGMPSIKTLDYTIRENAQSNTPLAQETPSVAFATKDEVNILSDKINALQGKIEGLTAKPVGRPKKEVTGDE